LISDTCTQSIRNRNRINISIGFGIGFGIGIGIGIGIGGIGTTILRDFRRSIT
jgi:hypothetical protein